MNKVLFGMLLIAISTSALAEWVVVAQNSDAGVTTYANTSKIKKVGKYVRIWTIKDYEKEQENTVSGPPYLSSASLQEFDCKEEQYRLRSLTWFAGNMRNGDVIYNGYLVDKWRVVSPDTLTDAMMKIACKK